MPTDNAYPNNELTHLIDDQRDDTSAWQNQQNHSPNPNLNPDSLNADETMPDVERNMETEVTAKVFVSDINNIEGGKVLLASDDFQVIGKIVTDAEDGFAVEWRTGRKSIEKKSNYDLVVVASEEEDGDSYSRCPACGDPSDYCRGHGEIGDPEGSKILEQHDDGNHEDCHEAADCRS